MASLQSLLELRALLDVLESQRPPDKSVRLVKSRKPFKSTQAHPRPAASQRSDETSPDNSSSAQCGRGERGSPLAEEGASPHPLFSNT